LKDHGKYRRNPSNSSSGEAASIQMETKALEELQDKRKQSSSICQGNSINRNEKETAERDRLQLAAEFRLNVNMASWVLFINPLGSPAAEAQRNPETESLQLNLSREQYRWKDSRRSGRTQLYLLGDAFLLMLTSYLRYSSLITYIVLPQRLRRSNERIVSGN
jgi:hypothetical protein